MAFPIFFDATPYITSFSVKKTLFKYFIFSANYHAYTQMYIDTMYHYVV